MAVNFIYMTASSKAEAQKIGKALVESRLAACVNILDNMESIYRWDEEIQVGLVGHVPDDEVDYYIRGKKVEKFLDHKTVIVLDLSEFADVSEGEEVSMVFKGGSSVLDTSYSAPITLQDGVQD